MSATRKRRGFRRGRPPSSRSMTISLPSEDSSHEAGCWKTGRSGQKHRSASPSSDVSSSRPVPMTPATVRRAALVDQRQSVKSRNAVSIAPCCPSPWWWRSSAGTSQWWVECRPRTPRRASSCQSSSTLAACHASAKSSAHHRSHFLSASSPKGGLLSRTLVPPYGSSGSSQ